MRVKELFQNGVTNLNNDTMGINSKEYMYKFLEKMHEDVVILDGQGVILWVSPSFETTYGIPGKEAVGKTAYEMEKNKIYYPSVAVRVLETRQITTVIEYSKTGKRSIVTGIPMFNDKNEIEYIVSYSFDITYLTKLMDQYSHLQKVVERYSAELYELREKEKSFPDIIAQSPHMRNVIQLALKVSSVDTNVLITGESGVGKNVIAKLIHEASSRNKGPFIEINCSAIPENLLESELFGYEDGAFTGAKKKGKVGMIELANEGTLFLNEIGELPLSLQAKLLKVIQDKSVTRLGGTRAITVDYCLISATNQDLDKNIKENIFREDLFYRLCVVPIKIPPLRERREDIYPLINYFLKQANDRYQKDKSISGQAYDILISYDWPGNVRQLQNMIERLVVISEEDYIAVHNLPDYIKPLSLIDHAKHDNLQGMLEAYEGHIIKKAYEKYKTTVGVAEALGISQATAVRKIKKYIP